MPDIEFGCRATIIGSMPHTDPQAACSLITRYLGDFPAWPQLPQRSPRENMYVQFSEGFYGVTPAKEGGIYIDRAYTDPSKDIAKFVGDLYGDYDEDKKECKVDEYSISPDYAAGLYAFLELKNLSPLAVKGQVTGPVTWGLTVPDETGRAIIYDANFQDMVATFLGLKAGWQEKQLKKLCKNTIIFVDEPYMAAFGSVAVPISKDEVHKLLNKVFACIKGLKGIHCCGNTDWSILLQTKADIISFDAYHYAQSLSLYPSEVKKFLDRGGVVAWGVVPNDEESLARESTASLRDRLEETMAPFTRHNIEFKQLVKQGLLTPSCGLGSINSEDAAEQALKLLAELSAGIRKRYSP
jgi:methionine synthase II (cobalamin-independent)